MKISLAIGILLSTAVSFAANDGAPELCPKFYCVAETSGVDYHHMQPGFGYADVLATAQQNALSDCQAKLGGDCAVTSCQKYTGPVLHLFNTCQSQWGDQ